MPTYEYKCDACGHEFEEFKSITAPVRRTCPRCGKKKLQRLMGTGAGIIFKGGGFYETDYRSDSYKKSAEADRKSAEPVKAEAKAQATTDAAPKSETKKESAAPSKKRRKKSD